jgi:hypothetical protein
MPAITGHKDGPVIFRNACVADRRTPSLVFELGSETSGKVLLPTPQPEQFYSSNGEQQGNRSDAYRRHRWLRSARRNTAVDRSIVGHSQSETEIRGERVDSHAGEDSNGTGEDDTIDDDDQDHEGGPESKWKRNE